MLIRQVQQLSAARVDSVLAEVLARPAYAPAEAPPLYRVLGAVRRWLGDHVWPLIERILPDVDWSSPAVARGVRIAVSVGALVGIALLVYLGALAFRAWRQRQRKRPGRDAVAGPRGPVTAADWDALARESAARGDWREAALALYQAVVLRLGEARVVGVDPSKTPGDYRREVRRGRSDVAPAVEGFLRAFERLAYGPGSPGADQYGRLRDAAIALGGHG